MSSTTPAPEELPRLLLVEDSETSATLISRHLRGRYELRHARNGEEAWKMLLGDHKIELVVTDIQMPKMSGHELLRVIRESSQPQIANIPVIVMTTADDNKERNLAFAGGANDFILKPVDPIELQARVGVHQKLARTIRELEAHRKLLEEQAITDPLTKLKNRRAFFTEGARHLAASRRHGSDLSVMALDLDNFKSINDTFGHRAGDEVLQRAADIIRANTRAEDTPARIGGEEFAVLLPDTNRLGAAVMAERIREALEKTTVEIDGRTIALTLSGGIASFGADGQDTLEQLLGAADKRLYKAKQSGRNRIVIDDDGRTVN